MTSCESIEAQYQEVNEALASLESAINGLDIPSIDGLSAKIARLESDVSTLKGQTLEARNTASKAERSASKAITDILALGGIVSFMKGDISQLSGGVSRLTQDTQSLFRGVSNLKGDISYIGKTASGAANLAKDAVSDISGLKPKVFDAVQRSGLADRRAQNAIKESARLGGKIAGIFSIIAGLATLAALAALQAQINSVRSTANEGRDTARHALSHSGEVEKALNSFEEYMKSSLFKLERLFKAKIAELDKKFLKEIERVLDFASKKFEELSAKIGKLSSLIQQVENSLKAYVDFKIQGLIPRFEKLSQAIQRIESNLKEYIDSEIQGLLSKIQQLNQLIQRIESNLKEYINSEIQRLLSKIQELRQLIQKIESNLKEYIKSEIQRLLFKIQGLRQLIQEIESSLKEYIDSEIQGLLSKIQQLNQLIQRIESNLKEYINSEIQRLLSKIQELRQLIQKIESSLKEYIKSEIQRLLSKIQELRQLIQKIESNLKEYIKSEIQKILSKLESLKNFLQAQIPLIIAAAAAVALAQLLAKLPNLIKQNTPQMTCRFNDVAAREAATTAKRHEQKFNIFQNFVQLTMWADIKNSFKGTFDRLGAILPNGGIAGRLLKMSAGAAWNKAMSALTFLAVLHNAQMLSSALYTTMTETLSIGIDIVQTGLGMKDDNDEPIDVQQVLGVQFNSWMAGLLGAQRWTEVKQTFAAANRIYQSASNIVYTLRSITDSSLAIAQWTAENLAKIGNGLKADGVVSNLAYGWMPEVVTPQTALINRLNNLDDAASSLNMVVSEVKSIQEESAELANQKQEFDQKLTEGKTQKEELVRAWETSSQSPALSNSDINKED